MDTRLKQGDNRRLIEGTWHLWGDHTPNHVDGNEGYFDRVVENFRSGDPMSESGTTFKLFLGKPGEFITAEFILIGIKKIVTQEATTENPAIFFHRPIVKRLTEWAEYNMSASQVPVPEKKPEIYIKTDGRVIWNPGKQTHQVLVDGEVVYESADKQEAIEIANGSRTLP